MPFHAAVHREQLHRPQTGFHATSSEEGGGDSGAGGPRGSGRNLTFHGGFRHVETDGGGHLTHRAETLINPDLMENVPVENIMTSTVT